MKIAINRVQFPITTLGFGRRVGIWFQGCSIQCPGCISKDTWNANEGRLDFGELTGHLTQWLPQADGITLSGGEPFDQPEALRALLTWLREHTNGDLMIYSGYPWEKLALILSEWPHQPDILICDPYQEGAAQTLPLRGSDNQQVVFLTDLGRERFPAAERFVAAQTRKLDIFFDDAGEVWMAGIPRRGDMERLQDSLMEKGFSSRTSAGGIRRYA